MLKNPLMRCLLATGILAAAICPAQAGLMRDGVSDDLYRAYGQSAAYESVGWLGRYDADGNFLAGGSGVLIDPYWVLLSGHQLTDQSYSSLAFGTGSNLFSNPGTTSAISATYIYPGYTGGWGGSRNDIALACLVDPIWDVAPAERFYGSDQVGTHVSMVGYGTPSYLSTGDLDYDGEKRGGENQISYIGRVNFGIGTNYFLTTFSPHLDSRNTLPMEFGSTPGDSGGGLFNNEGQLIGLMNFGYGNQNAYTGGIRVSLYNEWIDETLASSQVPEPSSFILFLGTLAFLPILRRLKVGV